MSAWFQEGISAKSWEICRDMKGSPEGRSLVQGSNMVEDFKEMFIMHTVMFIKWLHCKMVKNTHMKSLSASSFSILSWANVTDPAVTEGSGVNCVWLLTVRFLMGVDPGVWPDRSDIAWLYSARMWPAITTCTLGKALGKAGRGGRTCHTCLSWTHQRTEEVARKHSNSTHQMLFSNDSSTSSFIIHYLAYYTNCICIHHLVYYICTLSSILDMMHII